MAETVQDLLVQVTPEGIEETNRQLENQQETMQETAETSGESANKMEAFAARWDGAMSAIVAGLAVATAGLATKIPVVQELMVGLEGIISSLAFKLDQDLRPALEDVRGELFETQKKIQDSDGAFEGFLVTIGGVTDAIHELQTGLFEELTGIDVTENPILDFWFKLASLNFGSLADDAVGAIQTIRDEGFSGFGENMAEEFGFREEITNLDQVGADIINQIETGFNNQVGNLTEMGEQIPQDIASGVDDFLFRAKFKAQDLGNRIKNNITDKIDQAKEWGAGIPKDIANGIDNRISDVQARAENIADKIGEKIPTFNEAKQWGKDLVDGIIQGLQEKSTELGNAVEEHLSQVIRDRLPGSDAETGPLSDLSTTGPALVETFAGGMEQATPRAESAAESVADAADPQAGGGFAARRETQPMLVMDGRTLTEQDGRYRRDQTARRGRNG